jgi:NAD(P)-dependent dehydrogenase (short-subunit alcohol dehydrogenase family)
MNQQPKPPFPRQQQPMPGRTDKMRPKPDHGEESYHGSGKLAGKKAVITGADSGIGRAVAIAYARAGADILIAYLNEHDDAKETQRLVEEAGRKAVLVAGDIGSPAHCRAMIDKAVAQLGGIDILVNNAAHQATFESIEDISDEEWELTFRVNIHAMAFPPRRKVKGRPRRTAPASLSWGGCAPVAFAGQLLVLNAMVVIAPAARHGALMTTGMDVVTPANEYVVGHCRASFWCRSLS